METPYKNSFEMQKQITPVALLVIHIHEKLRGWAQCGFLRLLLQYLPTVNCRVVDVN